MKIGAFAKKFDTNVSTIRHYINSGLLVPERKSGQYEFGKACVEDMEKILKYKNYHFSLEEIQLLFFLEKASRFQDELVLNVCANILKNKRDSLIQEKKELDVSIKELEKDIDALPQAMEEAPHPWGVPFSFIPYLYCPKCQNPLRLDSASLSNGFLYSGDLTCECGYDAEIKDGIILSKGYKEDTPFKAFDNVDSVISMMDEFSPAYRALIGKAYYWMYNQIPQEAEEAQHILTGPFTFNFLLEYLDKLGKRSTYIISDPSLKRINKLKQYFQTSEHDIIYIVGDMKHLPLKHGSLDFYIDDYSTVNSLFTYNNYGTEFIAPFLKRKGKVTGIYTGYKKAPKSIQRFKEMHPQFEPGHMKYAILKHEWETNQIKIKDEKDFGETGTTELNFPANVIGEPISVQSYLGVKET